MKLLTYVIIFGFITALYASIANEAFVQMMKEFTETERWSSIFLNWVGITFASGVLFAIYAFVMALAWIGIEESFPDKTK